jgi:hypothetical protein
MFGGLYQLGSILPLQLWCRTAAGVPTEPDAAPLVQITNEDGEIVLAKKLPIMDRQRVTGYFHYRLVLDARFDTTGRHSVFYTYKIAGTHFACLSEIEIIPGGDSRGAGISMSTFRQSAADFVLLQNHGGTLEKLKNPEVRNR